MFLLIGILLFVFYSDRRLAAPQPPDRLYPSFIWQYLPTGVAGLVMAAILAAAMSNLSAALNSLASTTIMDFYRPMRVAHGDPDQVRQEQGDLKLARAATIAWGVVLVAIGVLARHWGPVLEAGLTIASIAYGGLLGVFLLGRAATPYPGERRDCRDGGGGRRRRLIRVATHIAWTWYVAIGTVITLPRGA